MFGAQGLVSRNGQANRLSPASGTVWYAFDERGNVAQRVGSNGALLSTDVYDAYGNKRAGPADVFGFGGQAGYYTDTETGLILCTHRHYDPQQGRFLTRDPIGYDGGINLYSYTQNNPVNWMDPDGTDAFDNGIIAVTTTLGGLAGGTIGGGIGAAGGTLVGPEGTIIGGGYGVYQGAFWGGVAGAAVGSVIVGLRHGGIPHIFPGEVPPPAPVLENRRGSKGVATLRREWERLNGRSWPTDENGRRHIAEHKQPLADGGADDGSNIEPLTPEEHTQQHKDRGDFQRWGKRSGKGESCPSP